MGYERGYEQSGLAIYGNYVLHLLRICADEGDGDVVRFAHVID